MHILLNSKIDVNDINTWPSGLKVFAGVVGFFAILVFLVSIVWFFTYIKYSWFKTTNSANLTGGQLAKTYLEKYGVNASRIKFRGTGDGFINNVIVEPKFFYLRPYLISNNSLTLRLVPWTYHRQSIYTLAMAMESAWAVSSSKSNRANTFWWDFSRKITLVIILLPFVLALILIFGNTGFLSANSNKFAIVLSILGGIFLIFFMLSQVMFYGKSRKEICENLHGILQDNEIRAINWIFQIKFIYYIIRMIYEVLRLILQITLYVMSEKR